MRYSAVIPVLIFILLASCWLHLWERDRYNQLRYYYQEQNKLIFQLKQALDEETTKYENLKTKTHSF